MVTVYGYDERENLTSITDPNNNTTTYTYDGINRNTSVVYADGKILSYVYDKNSNVASQTDPNGTVTTNSYDTTNLLLGRSMSTGSGVIGITSESYAYDSLNRVISGTDSSANALTFGYDSLSRLVNENSSGSTVGYVYDGNGNRTSVSSGTGYVANYSYDGLGRLLNVSYNSGSIANYTYTGVLNTGISYGNGVNTNYGYDGLLRLSSLSHTNGSGSIASRSYGYDLVGNIISDGQKSYGYDTIDRLLSTTALSGVTVPNSQEVFSYDKTGNRNSNILGNTTNTYSGNVLNQYLSVTSSGSSTGSVAYVYDNNGNVISNGVFSFAYDYKNRLVRVKKVSDNSIVVQFVYNILGRRVQKITSDAQISFVYAGENAISEVSTNLVGSGVVRTSRVFGNSIDDMLAYETDDNTLGNEDGDEYAFCAAKVIPSNADFTKYGWTSLVSRCNDLQNQYTTTARKMFFVQKDHLGSTIALTDASGSVVQSYAYDVYGSPYVKSESGYIAMKDFSGNLHGNSRFFTGREYDGEIGLYYLRARYYSADTGRFISRDPIGQVDDVNLYGYVGNSPMMGVDPSGEVKQAISIAGMATIGAFI